MSLNLFSRSSNAIANGPPSDDHECGHIEDDSNDDDDDDDDDDGEFIVEDFRDFAW